MMHAGMDHDAGKRNPAAGCAAGESFLFCYLT